MPVHNCITWSLLRCLILKHSVTTPRNDSESGCNLVPRRCLYSFNGNNESLIDVNDTIRIKFVSKTERTGGILSLQFGYCWDMAVASVAVDVCRVCFEESSGRAEKVVRWYGKWWEWFSYFAMNNTTACRRYYTRLPDDFFLFFALTVGSECSCRICVRYPFGETSISSTWIVLIVCLSLHVNSLSSHLRGKRT